MPRDFNSEDELARAENARVVPLPHLPAPVDPVLEVLVKARAYVAAGWCGHPYSIDAEGNENHDCSDEAAIMRGVKFCAAGALWRIHYSLGLESIITKITAGQLLNRVAQAEGFDSSIHINRERGQAGALDIYDRAISARKQEGVASVSASAEGGSHSPNSPAVLASKGA